MTGQITLDQLGLTGEELKQLNDGDVIELKFVQVLTTETDLNRWAGEITRTLDYIRIGVTK
jgi:hypothetical protein